MKSFVHMYHDDSNSSSNDDDHSGEEEEEEDDDDDDNNNNGSKLFKKLGKNDTLHVNSHERSGKKQRRKKEVNACDTELYSFYRLRKYGEVTHRDNLIDFKGFPYVCLEKLNRIIDDIERQVDLSCKPSNKGKEKMTPLQGGNSFRFNQQISVQGTDVNMTDIADLYYIKANMNFDLQDYESAYSNFQKSLDIYESELEKCNCNLVGSAPSLASSHLSSPFSSSSCNHFSDPQLSKSKEKPFTEHSTHEIDHNGSWKKSNITSSFNHVSTENGKTSPTGIDINTKNYEQVTSTSTYPESFHENCTKRKQILDKMTLLYFDLGDLFLSKQQLDKAIEYHMKSINLNPNFPVSYISKALCLSGLYRKKKVLHFENEFEELDELNENDSSENQQPGISHNIQQSSSIPHDTISNGCSQSIDMNGGSSQYTSNTMSEDEHSTSINAEKLLSHKMKVGKDDHLLDAFKDCDTALSLDPTYYDGLVLKAFIEYTCCKNYSKAKDYFTKAILQCPQRKIAYLHRSSMLFDLREYHQVIQDAKSAIDCKDYYARKHDPTMDEHSVKKRNYILLNQNPFIRKAFYNKYCCPCCCPCHNYHVLTYQRLHTDLNTFSLRALSYYGLSQASEAYRDFTIAYEAAKSLSEIQTNKTLMDEEEEEEYEDNDMILEYVKNKTYANDSVSSEYEDNGQLGGLEMLNTSLNRAMCSIMLHSYRDAIYDFDKACQYSNSAIKQFRKLMNNCLFLMQRNDPYGKIE